MSVCVCVCLSFLLSWLCASGIFFFFLHLSLKLYLLFIWPSSTSSPVSHSLFYLFHYSWIFFKKLQQEKIMVWTKTGDLLTHQSPPAASLCRLWSLYNSRFITQLWLPPIRSLKWCHLMKSSMVSRCVLPSLLPWVPSLLHSWLHSAINPETKARESCSASQSLWCRSWSVCVAVYSLLCGDLTF